MNEALPLLLLTVVFFLVSTPVFAIDVVLKVDGANKLVIDTNSQMCQPAQKNCIKINKGNSPFIYFKLLNACSGNSGDPIYKLNEMQLSMIGNDGTAARPSKAFGTYVLPQPVYDDFNADQTTGMVKFTAPNFLANNLIRLKNKNSAEYVVFFKIKAVACTSGTVPAAIELDPRIKNTGQN